MDPHAVICLRGASGPQCGAGKPLCLQVQVGHLFSCLHLCGQRVQLAVGRVLDTPFVICFLPGRAVCLLLSPQCIRPWARRRILLAFPPETWPSSSVFNAPYFSNCGTRTAWPTAANAHAKERGRRGEEGRRTVVNVSLRRRHRRKLGVLVGAGVTCFDRLVHGIKLTSGSRERSLSCPARGRCRVLSSTGPGCCRAGVTPTHCHLLPVPQTRVFHCVDFSLIWRSSKGTGMNHATKRSRCTFLAYRRNPTSGPPSALIIPVFITASGHEHESS